ncbi:MAG: transporter [Actinotalea sp.]|nr:transporter [Actinotalea sp.]
MLRLGTLSVAGGIACAALAMTTAPVAVSIVGWGLGGLGMGLVYPTLALLTLRLSPLLEQGRNTSSLQISEALTVAVVLAVSGAVYTTLVRTAPLGAFVACFTLAAGLALAAAALAGRVAQRT